MDSLASIFSYNPSDSVGIRLESMVQSFDWWSPAFQEKRIVGPAGLCISSSSSATITSSDGIHLTSDIRLDNRKELIHKYGFPDDIANASIIINLYKKVDISVVSDLIGVFVIILYDERKQRLFCARDQMGIKPLYYYSDNERVLVSTEKKAILSQAEVDKTPNWHYWLVRSLTPPLHAAPQDTEYNSISRLQPGHYLIAENKKISLHKYWSPPTDKSIRYKKSSDYVEGFVEHMKSAISCRIADTESFGCHLSGGLDSSGITGVGSLVAQETNKQLYTFSYVVPPQYAKSDLPFTVENPYVNQQIDFADVQHPYRIAKPELKSATKAIVAECQLLDGLSQSGNYALEFEILYHAKAKVPVILSGFGGDELASSFCRAYYLEYLERGDYRSYFRSKTTANIPRWQLLLPLLVKLTESIGVHRFSQSLAVQRHKRITKTLRQSAQQQSHLFSAEFLAAHPEVVEAMKYNSEPETHASIPTSLREYQAHHIARQHTSRRAESENAVAKAFGISYRYPFLDLRLIEYMLSVPMEEKWSKDMKRYLYKRAMKPYVHPNILDRDDKQGSLKPMNNFYPTEGYHSMFRLYEDLEQNGYMDFVDNQKILKHKLIREIPNNFSMYLRIGLLRKQGKLQF